MARVGEEFPFACGLSFLKTSSFFAIKLDIRHPKVEYRDMIATTNTAGIRRRSVVGRVRVRIEAEGERVWRAADFLGMDRSWTAHAVAQALSRLARQGVVRRLGKGLYYRGRETAFGPSVPSPGMIQSVPLAGRAVFPAGHAAAGLLGLTTQQPALPEIATTGGSLPRMIVGKHAVIHTRRPTSWGGLDAEDAAILGVLRQRALTSELSPQETIKRLLSHMKKSGRFARLCRVASTEPPRVRAMLGAIGQQLGRSSRELERLRRTLNQLSTFDFGKLATLKHAAEWQARRGR